MFYLCYFVARPVGRGRVVYFVVFDIFVWEEFSCFVFDIFNELFGCNMCVV